MDAASTVVPRRPEFRMNFPVWCHSHGSKMRVKHFGPLGRTLDIAGSAASIVITHASASVEGADGWIVEWAVVQTVVHNQVDTGRRHFTDHELAVAFGLTDEIMPFSGWMIERYGGDAASQGNFIRWHEFLNIPGPGTGHDGDTNVSVRVDDEMRDAVRALLEGAGYVVL